jgi:hypothetical protein
MNTETGARSATGYLLRGSLGFTAVSLAAFGVWAVAGKWLGARLGEAGFYAVEAVIFVALSGLVLHPLAGGPNSFFRFLRIFVPAHVAYTVVWCASWFALRFGLGEWLGSLGGCAAFALVAGALGGNLRAVPASTGVLFVTHSAGYFLGGPLHYKSGPEHHLLGILGWGLLYGLGFGAGIGYTFYRLQRPGAPPVAA